MKLLFLSRAIVVQARALRLHLRGKVRPDLSVVLFLLLFLLSPLQIVGVASAPPSFRGIVRGPPGGGGPFISWGPLALGMPRSRPYPMLLRHFVARECPFGLHSSRTRL